MHTIIKFIAKDCTPISDAWIKNPDSAFSALPALEKAVFLLQQAVALNYLSKVYNGGLSPDLEEYKNKCSKWWLPAVGRELDEMEEEGVVKTMLKSAYESCRILLDLIPGTINRELIPEILATEYSGPTTIDASFYVPYLAFLEKAPRCLQITEPEMQKKESFQSENVSLPTFFYSGRILKVSYDAVFTSYVYDVAFISSFGNQPNTNGVDGIFAYWAGYNWTGKSFNCVVGLLAMYALELDANITQNNKPALDAFRALYSYVFSWMSHVDNKSALSSDTLFFRRCILSFLVMIRDRYSVLFDDKELLLNLLDDTIKDADNMHKFLEAEKPSEISVELYKSFRTSIFGRFAELDNYKLLITGGSESSINATTKKKETDEDGDTTQEPDEEDPEKEGSDAPEETPATEEPNDVPAVPEVDPETTPTTGEDGTDSEGEPGSDEPANSDSNPTDDEPNADDSTTTEDKATHTQIRLPKVGDSKGVKLELSQGESFDTVLFRFELEHFIDAILARPPKSFSPTKIQYLAKLKANWINVLAPKCLVDMISKLVRVPKTFNIK